MPYLSISISAAGPVIDIGIGVTEARAKALQAAGKVVPPARKIRGLIDTGASCTAVDTKVLKMFHLQPTGSVPIHTPSTQGIARNADQYDVRLHLLHSDMVLPIDAVPVVDAALANQGIEALIGRDILSRCLFVYDGQSAMFSLAF